MLFYYVKTLSGSINYYDFIWTSERSIYMTVINFQNWRILNFIFYWSSFKISEPRCSSEVCRKTSKPLKLKESEKSPSRKRKKENSSNVEVRTKWKSDDENSESSENKKLKLDLNSLVLDYLDQEGFVEVRNDLAAALQKKKVRKRKSSESSSREPTSTTEPEVSANPTSFSDFFVYSYLVSNPDFAEVAEDLEKARGPFLQFDFRADDSVAPKSRKRKSTHPSDLSQFRESSAAAYGAGDLQAPDEFTADALPTQELASQRHYQVRNRLILKQT